MDKEFDLYALLKEIKSFAERSNNRFKEQKQRIKEDKEFLWVKPYPDTMNKILGTERYRGHLDVVSNAIRSVVNSYTSYPYKPRVNDNLLSQCFNKLTDNINEAVEDAFKSAVSFGIGYVVVLPQAKNGVIAPNAYSIERSENVFYDPDSTSMCGADAKEVLIVDYKSKKFLEDTYGEEIKSKLTGELSLTLPEATPDDMGVIYTYFKFEDGIVTVYKIVGDTLVEEPIQLVLKQIPIIPVYGEPFELEGKRYFRGLVAQTKAIQNITDMTFSQLMERLAKSPKTIWLTTHKQIEGKEEYFQNSDKNINQVLEYNDVAKGGKEKLDPPQRIDQTVQYNDLTDIMSHNIDLMQSVVGVHSIGLPDEKNEITATEALLNAKTYNNNVRHFMQHLKYSFRVLCELIAEYFGQQLEIVIENGPQENLERQTARQELMALTQMLEDPTDRKRAVVAITQTMADNKFVEPFLTAITTEDPQITQMKQQLTQMQQTYEQQIQELKNQNLLLKAQAISTDARNKDTLAKAELDNQTKIIIEQMKQQGLDGREAMKMVEQEEAEARKTQQDVFEDRLRMAGGNV